jgi:hypothetical protein
MPLLEGAKNNIFIYFLIETGENDPAGGCIIIIDLLFIHLYFS